MYIRNESVCSNSLIIQVMQMIVCGPFLNSSYTTPPVTNPGCHSPCSSLPPSLPPSLPSLPPSLPSLLPPSLPSLPPSLPLPRARIHPFNVLVALKTYESGHGEKGKLKWEVNQSVVSALDAAFYMSFKVRNGHHIRQSRVLSYGHCIRSTVSLNFR